MSTSATAISMPWPERANIPMRIFALTFGAQPTAGGMERFSHVLFRHMLWKEVDLHTYSHAAAYPICWRNAYPADKTRGQVFPLPTAASGPAW